MLAAFAGYVLNEIVAGKVPSEETIETRRNNVFTLLPVGRRGLPEEIKDAVAVAELSAGHEEGPFCAQPEVHSGKSV